MELKQIKDYEDYKRQQIIVSKYIPGGRSIETASDRFFDIADDLIEEAELTKDSYILDIGCRRGKGVKYFLDKGYKNTYGIDIGDEMIKINGDSNFKSVDMHESLGFDFKWDFVSIIHTLEHAYDIPKVLKLIHDSLNDDGILYIVIPKGEIENHAHFFAAETIHDIETFTNKTGFETVDKIITRNGSEFNYFLKKRESCTITI